MNFQNENDPFNFDAAPDEQNLRDQATNDADRHDESDFNADLADPFESETSPKDETFTSKGIGPNTSALWRAIKCRQERYASQILAASKSLHVNKKDELGKTILHHMCISGYVDCINKLLAHKPALNAVDKIGLTPLHYASMNGHICAVELLCEAGAEPNTVDKRTGRTPLHMALASKSNFTPEGLVKKLVHYGADPEKKDLSGKSAMDICKNESLQDILVVSSYTRNSQNGGVCGVEINEVEYNKPTAFANIGLVVTRSQTITDKDTPASEDPLATETKAEPSSFKMTIFRITSDNIGDRFNLTETEDICSDAFSYKLSRVSEPTVVDIKVPILSPPSAKEEVVLKANTGKEYPVKTVTEENEMFHCVISLDITEMDSFIIVSRPKVETFTVGEECAVIKSTVDERVELDIPKGTFEKDVTLSVEITDVPTDSSFDKVMTQCNDIASVSAFYAIEASEPNIMQPVAVKIPLPPNYKGGEIVLFTMNQKDENEGPDAWEQIQSPHTIIDGRVVFHVSSFSIKAAIERQASTVSSNSVSSLGSIASLQSQLSRVFRKSRRKEHTVGFIVASRRIGTSNSFNVKIMCCKEEVFSEKLEELTADGYQNHTAHKEPAFQELKVKTKQKFRIASDSISFEDEKDETIVEFHRKVDTPRMVRVTIPGNEPLMQETIHIHLIHDDQKPDQNSSTRVADLKSNESKVVSAKLSLIKFDPKMLSEMDSQSFLSYARMMEIQHAIETEGVWWKVLLLIDIPFKTIERMMSHYRGDVSSLVNGLLFEWRDKHRNNPNRGLPDLLIALKRSRLTHLVMNLLRDLLRWKNDPINKKNPLCNWLTDAYEYDLLIQPRFGKPMSDEFLAMVADKITFPEELADGLEISREEISDTLANTQTYPLKELQSLKVDVLIESLGLT
ncbi:uncharacterized protein LOC127852430 [Dreissena polymorpha]|uniref:uncharacterized protein LOC127852430 n=1 Tax=Dreissena polymorpha TaxID=45954 RepID=UPI002263EE88|nr:uncharacterized protein LOC127852430 [Dreissena polymorpha]